MALRSIWGPTSAQAASGSIPCSTSCRKGVTSYSVPQPCLLPAMYSPLYTWGIRGGGEWGLRACRVGRSRFLLLQRTLAWWKGA